MPKYKAHIRIPTELFKHPGYKGLAENQKPYALAIIVMLLKYVNQKTGECHPRYATIRNDIGCSKKTLTNYMHLLITAGLIKVKRLSSTNLYKINPILLVNEVNVIPQVAYDVHISGVPNAHINKTYIKEHIYRTYSNEMIKTNVDKIVNDNTLNKESKIIKLASLPLRELKECNNKHPYYVQKAIEHQEQELRAKKILPKHVVDQAITAAVSKTLKNRSAAYKAKVEYNKRNNLDWQGKQKTKV